MTQMEKDIKMRNTANRTQQQKPNTDLKKNDFDDNNQYQLNNDTS